MLKNYLLTGWRHMLANPLFSFINIFGLTVALCSCTLIILFVQDELSHDKDLVDADRIVRMHSRYVSGDAPDFLTVRSAGRMKAAISGYAPDLVESAVRLLRVSPTVRVDDRLFNETITFADGSFFDIFDLPFVESDAARSFTKPGDLIISEATAIKYFGRSDVVGEVMTVCCLMDEEIETVVTGVLRDLPQTSHLDIDMLMYLEESMFDFAPNLLATWTSVNTFTYFKLTPTASAEALKNRVWQWLDSESPFVDMVEEGTKPTDRFQPNFMAVPDLYLNASRDAGNMGDMKALGNITMIYAFSGITLLILALAAVNFMNLSTARASQRAREVGLRKVLGASRRQLAFQFLGEAIALSLVAMLLAMVLVEMLLPVYNELIDRQLEFSLVAELPLVAALALLAILVGLVAGSYPAAYLSRFLPAQVLRGSQGSDETGTRSLRNLLVIFQFAVSIALGVCTLVISAQTHYARTMDVGYRVNDKLVLHRVGSSGIADQQRLLRDRMQRIAGVESVVLSSEVPSQDNENNTVFTLLDGAGRDAVDEGLVLNYHNIGPGFLEAYGIELVSGRRFSESYGTDEILPLEEGAPRGNASVILNESAVRRLGLSSAEEALGKTLRGDLFAAGPYDLTVVGVVRDVYFRSLKYGVRATAYMQQPNRFREATISYRSGTNVVALRAAVEAAWREIAPQNPISSEFLNSMVEAQYIDEANQAKLFGAFSALALVIATLGLYGLAAFSADRRVREIGIRRVLGARVRDIVTLLVWQFSRPVLLANVVAWPVAWLLMQDWLESFVYRLGSGNIAVACAITGVLSLLIAWVTVAGRAVAVAKTRPAEVLRYE